MKDTISTTCFVGLVICGLFSLACNADIAAFLIPSEKPLHKFAQLTMTPETFLIVTVLMLSFIWIVIWTNDFDKDAVMVGFFASLCVPGLLLISLAIGGIYLFYIFFRNVIVPLWILVREKCGPWFKYMPQTV